MHLVVLLAVLLLFPVWGWGQSEVPLSAQITHQNLGDKLEYLEDAGHNLKLSDVQQSNLPWVVSNQSVLNKGYTHSAYWLKISFHNTSNDSLEKFVQLAYPQLDYIDFYLVRNNQLVQHQRTGDSLPFADRPLLHRDFILPMSFPPNDQSTLYIRVATSSAMQLPLEIWTPTNFYAADHYDVLGMGLFVGMMGAMMVFSMFTAFRQASFTLYVMYTVCITGLIVAISGFAYQHLWPDSPWLQKHNIALFLTGSVSSACLFIDRFLELSVNRHIYARFFRGLALVLFVAALTSLVLPYSISVQLIILTAIPAMLGGSTILLTVWKTQAKELRYFSLAWIALLLSSTFVAASKLGWIPRSYWTENAIQFGAMVESILLAYALTERSHRERVEKMAAEIKSLESEREAREAHEMTLVVQQQANENLEQKVKERTEELAAAMTELSRLNSTLKNLTEIDSLTGVRNRRYFDKRISNEWTFAKREQIPLSLLLVDVDHFKLINDQHGHLAGDDCLKAVAETLMSTLPRQSDCLARYGGEEFAVILPNTNLDGARIVGEAIRRCVERLEINLPHQVIKLTASVGIATEIPGNQISEDYLIANADAALYMAKNAGRNQVRIFSVDAA